MSLPRTKTDPDTGKLLTRLRRRGELSITEQRDYWQAEDGTVVELTEDELLQLDTSRSIADN